MDVGFIELACDVDRLHQYRRVAAFNRSCGVDVKEITPQEVKERFPLCETNDVLAGFYVDSDGRANPYDATMALAKGARQNGVCIFEGSGVSVDSVTTSKDDGAYLPKVTGVKLSNGEWIAANTVVNCAGMWARQLGERNGVCIPNQVGKLSVTFLFSISNELNQGFSKPVCSLLHTQKRRLSIIISLLIRLRKLIRHGQSSRIHPSVCTFVQKEEGL